MRDVVTSEAGDWLRPCHWLAGWLAQALEQWSEPTVTGDTAAPRGRSLAAWLLLPVAALEWLTGRGHCCSHWRWGPPAPWQAPAHSTSSTSSTCHALYLVL